MSLLEPKKQHDALLYRSALLLVDAALLTSPLSTLQVLPVAKAALGASPSIRRKYSLASTLGPVPVLDDMTDMLHHVLTRRDKSDPNSMLSQGT